MYETLQRIRLAFERRELELHYQPKVNLRTGAIIGAEALIRWQHPERGLLSPAAFLPLIEGQAVSIEIGEWVIDTALQQISKWHADGLTIPVSINVGANQLEQSDFASRLAALLAVHRDVQPHYLELEILETSVLADIKRVSRVMHQCRELGVLFSLDDFGTGFSSLTHLRHLPTDVVKIDRDFVRDMIDDPDDFSIVEGIIGMSGAFRRTVIAEGVESTAHGLMLLSLGCELAQGYAIAHPMPAQAFMAWSRTYRHDAEYSNFAEHQHTVVELMILQLRLESQSWLNHMRECIQTPKERSRCWPIMDHEKCHCGRWIRQARQQHHFDSSLLDRIEQEHVNLHNLGKKMMRQYQTGLCEAEYSAMEELAGYFEKIDRLLQQLN